MSRTSIFAIVIATAVSACAQSVISAHSGTIHYTEGTVTLDGASVQPKFGQFPEVKPEQVLATTEGRAEVLLTPGVFLRLSENSSFKMISNQLSNTRLEIQSGDAMIEVSELLEGNSIAIVFKGADVALSKSGLYRFDAMSDPAALKVYDGDAKVVSAASDPINVGKGHELVFGAKLEAKSFDSKQTDAFYRWSARRDEYVAEANISAAKTTRDAGYTGSGLSGAGYGSLGYGGMGYGGFGMGQWAWNPWFGMYTYVPSNSMFFSPFGFGYFSPFDVGYLYGPYSPFYGNYGGYYGGYAGFAPTRGAPAVATTASSITRAGGLSGAASRGGVFGNAGSNSSRGGLFGGGSSSSGMSSSAVGVHGGSGASMGGGSIGGGSAGGGHAGGVGSAGHK